MEKNDFLAGCSVGDVSASEYDCGGASGKEKSGEAGIAAGIRTRKRVSAACFIFPVHHALIVMSMYLPGRIMKK